MDEFLTARFEMGDSDLLDITADLEAAFEAAEKNLDFFKEDRVMASASGIRLKIVNDISYRLEMEVKMAS